MLQTPQLMPHDKTNPRKSWHLINQQVLMHNTNNNSQKETYSIDYRRREPQDREIQLASMFHWTHWSRMMKARQRETHTRGKRRVKEKIRQHWKKLSWMPLEIQWLIWVNTRTTLGTVHRKQKKRNMKIKRRSSADIGLIATIPTKSAHTSIQRKIVHISRNVSSERNVFIYIQMYGFSQ